MFAVGQQRPTRVIRLVAKQTIDEPILAEQQRRVNSTIVSEGLVPEVDVGTAVQLLEQHPPPFQSLDSIAELGTSGDAAVPTEQDHNPT